jgi:hypothetical protein
MTCAALLYVSFVQSYPAQGKTESKSLTTTPHVPGVYERERTWPLTGQKYRSGREGVGVTLDVSYHFMLNKDARPGTYSWPLMIAIRPV